MKAVAAVTQSFGWPSQGPSLSQHGKASGEAASLHASPLGKLVARMASAHNRVCVLLTTGATLGSR